MTDAVRFDPLVVDAYEGDGRKDWAALADAGYPWSGAFLKVSQGTYYNGGTWLSGAWKLVGLAAAHANRGKDWIRGGYHYLDVRQSGALQADYFANTIKRIAGGFSERDIVMVDVESSDQRRAEAVTAGQVVDRVSEFSGRIRQIAGKATVLYGGSWLRDLGVIDRMGCKYLVVARYTDDLPYMVYTSIGWGRDSLLGWQYCGVDGKGNATSKLHTPGGELAGVPYPSSAPGCGPIDITAIVLPGGMAAIEP